MNNCFTWGNCNSLWSDADWKWSECGKRVTCYKWGNCDVLWCDADWWWSKCRYGEPIPPVPPTPETPIIHVGIPGELALPPWYDEFLHDPYKKIKEKKFISLTCKIKGESEYEEKKEVKKDIKLNLNDAKVTLKSINGINIQLLED